MYDKDLHIHFVGCGGIGMSGLALLCKARGYQVSGCDKATETAVVKHLKYNNCDIMTGHDSVHVGNADVVVYSSALPGNHPELAAARAANIPTVTRGAFLAELVSKQYSIAVAGMHGKTTTSSLLGHVLSDCGVLPTVVTGGVMLNSKTQMLAGQSDWAVVEADESDKSLLHLRPTVGIITNIEHEHVDTYPDMASVHQVFKQFLDNIPFYGTAVLCYDDTNTRNMRRIWHGNAITYGLDAHSHLRGHIVTLAGDHTIFNTSHHQHGLLGTVRLPLVGRHNVQNALAVIAVAHYVMGIPFNKIQKSLERFKGVARRLEYKGSFNNAAIFDDYAHHPTEIDAVLRAALNREHNNLHVVFQHHRFTRTKELWDDFIKVFYKLSQCLDTLHLLPIYAASEKPIDGISMDSFADALQEKVPHLKVYRYQDPQEVADGLRGMVTPGDLVMTLGAGNVTEVGGLVAG